MIDPEDAPAWLWLAIAAALIGAVWAVSEVIA